jgi:hypothetical protein
VIDQGNSHESGDSTAADRMPTWIGTSGIGRRETQRANG